MNSDNNELEFEESMRALKKLYDSGSESSLIDDLETTYRRLQDVNSDDEIFKSNSVKELIAAAINNQLENRASDLLTKADLSKHAIEVDTEIDKAKLSLENQVELLNEENAALNKKLVGHSEVHKILHSEIKKAGEKALGKNVELQKFMDDSKDEYEKRIDKLEGELAQLIVRFDSYKKESNIIKAARISREKELRQKLIDSWFFHTFRQKMLDCKEPKDVIQVVAESSIDSVDVSDVGDASSMELPDIPKEPKM